LKSGSSNSSRVAWVNRSVKSSSSGDQVKAPSPKIDWDSRKYSCAAEAWVSFGPRETATRRQMAFAIRQTSGRSDKSPARQNRSARMNTSPVNLGSPSKRPRVNSVRLIASRATLALARNACVSRRGLASRRRACANSVLLRRRRPDAPLFNDHRRRHAGPVAIVTERLEKRPVALVLRVFQATPDPDLGVIVRALRLITLRPHRPQISFDESTIRNRYRAALGVSRSTCFRLPLV
jgi:hypothetical protein